MPAHRLPPAKARATGADAKNPGRHADRTAKNTGRPLGAPSTFLDQSGQAAWEAFKRELPWLTEGHRAIMEICAQVRGELTGGGEMPGVTKLSMYQSMLSKLGATPVDESKVGYSEDDEDADDMFDA